MTVVQHVVVGPDQHGVTRFAVDLAEHAGGPLTRALRPEQVVPERADVAHLQFTDALYGRDCYSAAAAFVALAGRFDVPVTVTLHDLPDPADEPGRYRRRVEAYRQVVAAVAGVVVCSRHEARLLDLIAPVPAAVVPLPVDSPPARDPLPAGDPAAAGGPAPTGGPAPVGEAITAGGPAPAVNEREVAVLGFVHPGKGVAAALADLAGLADPITFTALGRAADGHEGLLPELEAAATAAGHRWQLTGFVPEAELMTRLRQVAVPLAPASSVSASASLNSWLAAGRRPLVLDGPYAREVAADRPGAITLYRPGDLAGAVAAALDDPARTWLPAGTAPGPDRDAAARAYRDVWSTVAAATPAGIPLAAPGLAPLADPTAPAPAAPAGTGAR